jgi:hypothetical protein
MKSATPVLMMLALSLPPVPLTPVFNNDINPKFLNLKLNIKLERQSVSGQFLSHTTG